MASFLVSLDEVEMGAPAVDEEEAINVAMAEVCSDLVALLLSTGLGREYG